MAVPRILAALSAAACGMVLHEIMQLRNTGERSVGLTPAAGATGLALLACLMLTFAPRRWWTRIRGVISSFQQRLQSAEVPLAVRTAVCLLAIAAVTCPLMLWRYLALPQDPWDDDQGAFLITASQIRDAGGVSWLYSALLSGEFPEANRHPLYLALLSLHPTLRGGQILSASIGVLGLLLLTIGLGRRQGWDVAGVFAVLLVTNAAFCRFSSTVVCDILMLVLGGAVWLIHVPRRKPEQDSVEVDSASHARSPFPRWWAAFISGAALGLAWLTKGTGLILLIGYLLWIAATAVLRSSAVRRGRRQEGKPPANTHSRPLVHAGLCVTGVVIAFCVIGSPLLIRNVKRFGNPLYNINSMLLFTDHYDELEPLLEQGQTTGEAARAWLATHTMMDIVRREASGLVWESYIILRSLGPAPLDDARVLFGLPLALLAATWMAARRSAADGLLLVWGIVCWLVFAWYVPIAAGERFILPLLAPILGTAAEAIVRLGRSSNDARRFCVISAAGWSLVWTGATWRV
jgi:hypothetical protein